MAVDATPDAATEAAGDAAASVARSLADLPTAGGPVDVATGDVVLAQPEVRLPGTLPLVLGRVHRSSYRAGRCFGRSWASDLDQRLVVAKGIVAFAVGDGSVLCYQRPGANSVTVQPMAGRRWPLARDSDGYTVTDPQAGVVRRFAQRPGYHVSADGEGELPLVSVTDRAGHKIRFGYRENGTPESVTHDGGYRVRVAVSGGRVAALWLAGAGPDGQDLPLTRYGYDQAGDLAEVVNSSGIPQRFRYDQAGRLTGWEDRNGSSYRYHYDEYGRCVRSEGPDRALSRRFGYDHEWLVSTCTDAAGAVTAYQVTRRGQMVGQTDPLGNVTRSEHDRYGRLVSRTDPLGRVTRWSYDAEGNLAGMTRPDGSRAFALYDERNLPLAVTQPDGATWQQDYDPAGNLTRRTGPNGAVTEYSYDRRGHLASVTGPDGATVTVECDPAGQPLAFTAPDGSRSACQRDGFGRITTATGPGGEVMRLDWTAEGYLASRTFPDGAAEQYAYDGEGNLTGHTDPAGGVTRFEYGGFGQMLARVWPDGTRTSFGYDHELRLARVTHGGITRRYEYDPAGRLAAETDYNGAVTRYRHDAAGQLTASVNAAGQELAFGYDLLGNVAERLADGVVTRFGHDAIGRLIRASGAGGELEIQRDVMGRVIAESCNGRTVRSAYDPAGRRVRRITPSGAEARWDYDAAGRPAALLSAGQELRFGYDQSGREIVRELPGGLRLDQEWDSAGRLAVQTLAAGPASAGAGLSWISPVVPAGPGGGGPVLQHRAYTYRADGCLTGLNDLLSGPRRLSLDAGGRVAAVAGPDWSERYDYDRAGNLTTAVWPAPPADLAAAWAGAGVQGSREYDGTLISRAGGVRYQHDACGRITRRQGVRDSRPPDTWRYEWDADSRLTAVTRPDGVRWQYVYDPLGRRIAKQQLTSDGQVAQQVSFTWDGPVLAEQASAGGPQSGQVVTWDYRPGTATPVTQLSRRTGAGRHSRLNATHDQADSQFYAIIGDLIGSPSELTAPDGSLAGYQLHTLWGATLWHPGGASTPLRLPGQYEDPETGLHSNHHSYYDPATGSYLSPGPLGLDPAAAAGQTRYAFGSMAACAPIGHSQFAQILKAEAACAAAIRPASCSTAQLPDGFVQQFAIQLGTPVETPNDVTSGAWAGPDGQAVPLTRCELTPPGAERGRAPDGRLGDQIRPYMYYRSSMRDAWLAEGVRS
jgi:RHS repeat-associated protein